jgi:hypothetical protein
MVGALQDSALPSKITNTDLNAEGNEIAVESIDLVNEGITTKRIGSCALFEFKLPRNSRVQQMADSTTDTTT